MENKPLSIQIEEFKRDIIDIINKKRLPVCIVSLIFKDLYLDIKETEKIQLQKDLEIYNQQQKEENNDV